MRCSYIYKKSSFSDDACPMCGTFDATDIHKEQMLDSTQTEAGLHQLFFERIPKVYEEMNLGIWNISKRSITVLILQLNPSSGNHYHLPSTE